VHTAASIFNRSTTELDSVSGMSHSSGGQNNSIDAPPIPEGSVSGRPATCQAEPNDRTREGTASRPSSASPGAGSQFIYQGCATTEVPAFEIRRRAAQEYTWQGNPDRPAPVPMDSVVVSAAAHSAQSSTVTAPRSART